jgi:CubicO group peptidase (beta-lactamase class C family)
MNHDGDSVRSAGRRRGPAENEPRSAGIRLLRKATLNRTARISALLALVVLAQIGWRSVGAQTGVRPAIFPGAEWEHIDKPQSAGASTTRLDALRATLSAGQTTGMLVVVRGRVLFEYGNAAEVSYIASARKSIVSMLYGKYVTNGTIPLGKSLRTLRVDDKGGLLPSELEATVGDLLAARSGVYHPAANLGDASDRAPARGSVKHGTYFLYNNWDFNALGAILERETGRSIYDLFTSDIAAQIGLEDWISKPGAYASFVRNDTGLSQFPAQHFVFSTRDMARIGYLMLRQGRWRSSQVIPAEWVKRSTSLITPASEVARTSPFIPGLGYGYLWWIFDSPPNKGTPLEGAYTASGAFGQYITVVPRLDMVVSHKTAVPPPRNVTNEAYFGTILSQVVTLVDPVR